MAGLSVWFVSLFIYLLVGLFLCLCRVCFVPSVVCLLNYFILFFCACCFCCIFVSLVSVKRQKKKPFSRLSPSRHLWGTTPLSFRPVFGSLSSTIPGICSHDPYITRFGGARRRCFQFNLPSPSPASPPRTGGSVCTLTVSFGLVYHRVALSLVLFPPALACVVTQELYGSWDQPTETVVLRKEDPNTLQLLALKFADKVPTRLNRCTAAVVVYCSCFVSAAGRVFFCFLKSGGILLLYLRPPETSSLTISGGYGK